MAQQSAVPALPEGFVLDSPVPGTPAPSSDLPALPPGFQLDQAAAAQPADDDDRWELTKGLLGGTFGTNPSMFGNSAEAIGHIVGSEDMVGFGKTVQGYGTEQLAQYQADVPSVVDIRTENVGDFIDDSLSYAGYQFGQGVASMAPSLVAGAGVGLMTANPVIGIVAGAAGPSYIQNLGDVYGGLKDELADKLESGEISYEDVSKVAMLAAIPMAALDLVGVGKVLGTFKGGKDAVKRALVSRIARAAAAGFTVEGVTEGLQEVISQFTQSTMSGADFATKERFIAVVDNAIAGGLAGGGIGGVGGAIAGDRKPAPEPTPKPGDVSRETKPADVPPPPEGFIVDPDTGIATPAPVAAGEPAEVPPAPVAEMPEVAPEPSEVVTEPVTATPQDIEQAVAEVETAPSEAQKEAGNYKKAHIKVHGLDVAIETPRDAERTGTGPDGQPWSVTMPAHYGYVKRTEGADGEQVDVYLGDNLDSRTVFIVDQVDPDTGKFDEHKAMIGFPGPNEALDTYQAGFSDGRGQDRAGAVTAMTVTEFKDWLANGDTKAPIGLEETEVSAAGPAAVPATRDTEAPAPVRGAGVSTLPEPVAPKPKKPATPQIAPIEGMTPLGLPEPAAEPEPTVTEENKAIQASINRREAARTRKRPSTPRDILQFIADEGGISDPDGDLKQMGAERVFIPGLGKMMRTGAKHPDKVRLRAEEEGYLQAGSYITDLYEIIDRQIRTGERQFSEFDRSRVVDMAEKEAAKDAKYYVNQVKKAANENHIDLTDQEIEEIAQIMDSPEGAGPLETIRDYVDNTAIEVVEENVAIDNDVDLEGLLLDLPELERPRYETAPDQKPEKLGTAVEEEVSPPRAGPEAAAEDETVGEPVRADVQAALVEPTTEQTDQGEQTVIPGAEQISDRELVERRMEAPARVTAEQRGLPEGGLFDEDARKQQDLMDILGPEDKAAAGAAPAFTPKFVEKSDKVIGEVKKILRAIAPNAQLRTVDTLWSDAGKTTQARGAYNWMRDLVTVSLGYGDPVNTIRHEAVHSLKAMGMFTESEWATLEQEGKRTWRSLYGVDGRYPDLSETGLNEEAVADAFADWRGGKQFAPGFRRIFQRIEDFLKRLGNALRGLGFRTVDDIFERVERGEVGRREGGPAQGEGVRYALSPDDEVVLQGIRNKIGADEPTLWQRLKDVIVERPLERIKQALFDDLHGLKLLEMASNDGKLYEDARSAYKLGRLSRGIGDVIFDSMYYGAPIWKEGTTSIDTSVKAPMQIIDDLGDRLGDFEIYIAMRRAQELKQPSEQYPEGRENLFTDAEIVAGLALGEANTDFAERFAEMQVYNKRILDFAQQSGLLGEDTRAFFDEMHQNYVPFFRIMEGGGTKGPRARLGFSGQHPNFHKLRGGTANIDHPLMNMEANIHRLIEASVKNVVMLRAAQQNAELGNIFMNPVARGVRQVAVTNAQMIRDLAKQGIEITAEDDINVDAIRTLWSLGNKPKGDNIVSLVRAGKVEFYDVTDPMLFRSLTMIHRTQIPFIQPFRMAKHLLTAAVGLDPSFQVANFLRDTMHASVISHIGFKPVVGSLRGFKSRMLKDADWRTFLQSGAGMSSLFEADRPTMHRVVETRIRKGHRPLGKILDSPRGFIGALEHMESTFEYSTRIGAFKKLRSEGVGLMEAAYQAREISTDFALKGDWIVMRLLAETVPFLNAGVQGLYRTARGAHENPVAFTVKGGLVAAASIALYLMNRDDDRYKALPPYQRDTYWHFWIGDQHYKIPKPFEVGAIFGSIPERMVEAAVDKERSDEFLERMQWIFSEMFRLSAVPQLAQPPLRIYSNWDDFRERPVIPPWLENVQAPEQYDTSTPITAVEAGRLTGQSPKKIQTLVDGYLGAWGGYLFSMADIAVRAIGDYPAAPATYLPERPVLRRLMGRDVPRSTYYTNQFYEMKREVDKTYASIQMLIGNGEADRARTMMREHKGKLAVRDSLIKINTQLTKINRVIRALRNSRTLTSKEKREREDELQIVKNKLTKAAFKLKPLFDKRTK